MRLLPFFDLVLGDDSAWQAPGFRCLRSIFRGRRNALKPLEKTAPRLGKTLLFEISTYIFRGARSIL